MHAIVIAKGVTDFANDCEPLKYGLHWDAVISRWAREHCERGRCPRRYKQVFDSKNFTYILCI